MLLNQGKKEMFCYMGCYSQKKKEVGRCVTVRNSPTISAPQRQTGYVSPLSLFQASFWIILEFEVFFVLFWPQRQNVPYPTPSLKSSGSLIQRSFPGTQFSLFHAQPYHLPSLTLLDFSSQHSILFFLNVFSAQNRAQHYQALKKIFIEQAN